MTIHIQMRLLLWELAQVLTGEREDQSELAQSHPSAPVQHQFPDNSALPSAHCSVQQHVQASRRVPGGAGLKKLLHSQRGVLSLDVLSRPHESGSLLGFSLQNQRLHVHRLWAEVSPELFLLPRKMAEPHQQPLFVDLQRICCNREVTRHLFTAKESIWCGFFWQQLLKSLSIQQWVNYHHISISCRTLLSCPPDILSDIWDMCSQISLYETTPDKVMVCASWTLSLIQI